MIGDVVILKGRMTAMEPIHVGSGMTIGTFAETLPYIPARSIRGMLGNYLYYQDRSGLFRELRFDDDQSPVLWFKPALPLNSVATPLLMKWCKKCGRLMIKTNNECPDDHHEGSKRSGLMSRESLKEKRFLSAGVRYNINTKCPIDPIRHSSYAKDEPLSPYNIQAILAGTVFDFRMVLPRAYVSDVMNALREAGIFYGVGGFRSRGYGMVNFWFENSPQGIDDYIRSRSREISSSSMMVMNSPTIFRSRNNGYIIGIEEDVLKDTICRNFGISDAKMGVHDRSFRHTYVRGWRVSRGRYYLDDMIPAVDLGSSAEVDIAPELAARIEVFGLGEMSHIYGDVYFCPLPSEVI